MSSGPSPVPVLVGAVIVLVAGIAALVVHDDHVATVTAPPSTTTTSSTVVSTSTTRHAVSTSTSTTAAAATVKPAVGSPEAAANGLWAAYTVSNRTAAQRFATEDVVRVLFEEPFDGERGTFLGCRPLDGVFDCRYAQPSTEYELTVKLDAGGSYEVVELTVSPST